jgi:hypothetical protein
MRAVVDILLVGVEGNSVQEAPLNFFSEIERQGKRAAKGGKGRQSKGKARQSLCPHRKPLPKPIQFYSIIRMATVKAFDLL